jgi:KDO2-lipid IV(A) lauroyltransferase
MKKRLHPAVAWPQYAAARSIAAALHALPLGAAVAAGRLLARTLYHADRRHRERCVEAIEASLDRPAAEAVGLARRMYEHLGTMLAEFPRLPRLRGAGLDACVDWGEVPQRAQALLAAGRGAIYVSGHIGNWEAGGAAFAARGLSVGAIARPLDNRFLDRWVRSVRQTNGQVIWDKWGALRSALRTLKEGRGFGILMDQDGGKDGVPTTFFGRPCSTWPTAAELARRTGAPLVAAALQRTAPMRFEAVMGEPFHARPDAEPAAETARLLQRCNDELEALIRRRPEQWLWLHRRWKTRQADLTLVKRGEAAPVAGATP